MNSVWTECFTDIPPHPLSPPSSPELCLSVDLSMLRAVRPPLCVSVSGCLGWDETQESLLRWRAAPSVTSGRLASDPRWAASPRHGLLHTAQMRRFYAACILQRTWIWVKILWLRIPNPTLLWDTRSTSAPNARERSGRWLGLCPLAAG